MDTEQLLVLVKSYPTFSRKYGQVWCIAGITEEGNWRRIYPIPMNNYLNIGKIPKRSLIEYQIRDTHPDGRTESRKIYPESLSILEKDIDIEKIREILIGEVTTLERLKEKNREDRTSLGVIKPLLLDFKIRDRNKSEMWEKRICQSTLDGKSIWIEQINKWIGYSFKCEKNEICKGHQCICIDSEVGNLYRKLKDKPDGAEKLRNRLFFWMKDRDLFFIMGTESYHNMWIIVSLFYPPIIT